MAALTFTGVVVFQQIGCIEGSGQDIVRINTPTGIVDLHLANSTTALLPKGQIVTVTTDTASIGVGWDFTFSNISVVTMNQGVTFDDIVAQTGATALAFHIPHGTVTGWAVGNKLNCGVKRV